MRKGVLKGLSVIALLAVAGILVFLIFSLREIRQENRQLRNSKLRLDNQLEKLDKERSYKQEYYYRLIHDDEFADRIIREKLGYVGSGELVFRFEDSESPKVLEKREDNSLTENEGEIKKSPVEKSETEKKPKETESLEFASPNPPKSEDFVLPKKIESVGNETTQPEKKLSRSSAKKKKLSPEAERAVRISERFK